MVIEYIIIFILGIITYIILRKYLQKKSKQKFITINSLIEKNIDLSTTEDIIKEQLKRNYLFFGEEGMKKIRDSTVVIINCENLGSGIAVTLVRSGVKKLILIDNNKLNIDNYECHPFATLENLNQNILDILFDYLKQINSNIELELIKENFNSDKIQTYINNNKINFIIDCLPEKEIINKCKLIKYITNNNISYISCFPPSFNQNDPTQIRHSKFSLVSNKHICDLLIENYKKLYGSGVPEINLVYYKQENENHENKFKQKLFSYSIITDTISSLVLCEISNFEMNKEHIKKEKEEVKIAGKTLSEAIEDYKKDEVEKKKTDFKYLTSLTYNDFYRVYMLFKGGSCLSQKPVSKMRFVRWRLFEEPSKNNIVIMGKSEINKHLKAHNEEELEQLYTKTVVDRIDSILNSN